MTEETWSKHQQLNHGRRFSNHKIVLKSLQQLLSNTRLQMYPFSGDSQKYGDQLEVTINLMVKRKEEVGRSLVALKRF